MCDSRTPLLYCAGDMRDHLYGLTEIVALSFTLYNMIVYFPGRYVVLAAQRDLQVSFVVPWIRLEVEHFQRS